MRRFSLLVLFILSTVSGIRAEAVRTGGGMPIEVTIDATKAGPPINPFIYGQFIEHLGRCIYGGIWAEMLEDRKFFFPITDDYHPYRDLTDTQFPVVGASPWQVLGPEHSVVMVDRRPSTKDVPFVGEHTPRVAAGSGFRQNDLGLVRGKTYKGYAWLRAVDKDAIVKVTLGESGGANQSVSINCRAAGTAYTRHEFELVAPKTTDQGQFELHVSANPVDVGAVSLMPADNVRGFRADTLALLKQLGATIYRWPGGNFVSGYDWRDGIGPRDRRPPRRNPAWTGVEHNDVGIDEFIDLCREIGAEPMIAANTGFGDDYSAAQEVEYANGTAETIGGAWRAKNGHREPFGVKYWCVGNEMFGKWQLGYMQLQHYTQKHNRVAQAMRKADPNIVLVGSGDLATPATLGDGGKQRQINWSQGMLEQCADNMDLISEHFYCGRTPWNKQEEIPVVEHVGMLRDEIRKKADGHRELQKTLGRATDKTIPIAMDEWNFWHRKYVYGELGCQYDLTDALGIAAGLHEYFRNSDIIQLAQYAQTVNVIGCIKTTKTDAFFDATALPLMLYRRECGTIPLDVTGNHAEQAIDIAAAKTTDGRAITIGIVNPQPTSQTIRIDVKNAKVGASATVWRIAGDDPRAHNTPDQQRVAIAEEKNVPFGDGIIIPAYSVNLYRVGLE